MNVVIYGGDKIPKKLLGIFQHYLDTRKHTLISLLMRSKLPHNHLGYYFRECLSISLNIEEIVNQAISTVQDEKNRLSFPMLLWFSFICTFVHEMTHNRQDMLGRDTLSDTSEKEATDDGFRIALLLAKEIDMELPQIGLDEWGPELESEIKDFFDSLDPTSDKLWEITQLACRDKGFVLHDPKDGSYTPTYKQFARTIIDDNDAAWDEVIDAIGPEIITDDPQGVTVMAAQAVEPITPVLVNAGIYDNSKQNLAPNVQFTDSGDTVTVGPTVMSASMAQPEAVTEEIDPDLVMDEYDDFAIQSDDEVMVSSHSVMPLNTAPSAMQVALESILFAMHTHIFDKCGFAPAMTESGFTQPAAVIAPISVAHIPNSEGMLLKMDTVDAHGKFTKDVIIENGIVQGLVTKKGRPYYKVTINVGGQSIVRSIMPVQVNDTVNGQLVPRGKWGPDAHKGVKRTIILDGSQMTSYIEEIGTAGPTFNKVSPRQQ